MGRGIPPSADHENRIMNQERKESVGTEKDLLNIISTTLFVRLAGIILTQIRVVM